MVTPTIRGRLLQCEASPQQADTVSVLMMGVGCPRSQRLGFRSPLKFSCLSPRSNWVERRLNCNPPQSFNAHPGTDIWQPSGSSGLVLVCVDLGPSLHDAFQGSGITTPQETITTQADRTLRYDFVTVNAHRTLLNFLVTARHYRCFSRARQSCLADVERKVSSHASSYKLPVQCAATAGYVE